MFQNISTTRKTTLVVRLATMYQLWSLKLKKGTMVAIFCHLLYWVACRAPQFYILCQLKVVVTSFAVELSVQLKDTVFFFTSKDFTNVLFVRLFFVNWINSHVFFLWQVKLFNSVNNFICNVISKPVVRNYRCIRFLIWNFLILQNMMQKKDAWGDLYFLRFQWSLLFQFPDIFLDNKV